MKGHPASRLLQVILAGAVVLLPGTVALAQATTSYTQFFAGPSAPVLAGGGPGRWDEFVREKVVVFEDGGIFKMWYVGHAADGQASSKIGYATSLDGITWTRYPGNPIVSRASQDQDMSVLKTGPTSYWMYIEVNNDHIDLMTSSDGVDWTPYAGNPVRSAAASPVVWREGENWFMLYEHMAVEPYDIHLATSTDGRSWIDSPANPVLAHSAFCVPDSILKDGATYHLYYHAGDLNAWHATSTDLTSWTDRTILLTGYSSQYVFRRANGELWSYIWLDTATPAYYLRYGRAVAYPLVWPLDEGRGTVADDATGQGVRGTLTNGPAWTPGLSGTALTFDGVDDFVATDFRLPLSAFTVAAWVRSPAAPTSGAASGPVHRNGAFQINWNHPDAAFRGAAALHASGSWHAASFGPLEANTWYHLAATYDGETLLAYRNGVLITSNSRPSGPPDPEEAPLALGRHAISDAFFAGSIDDVRLYDRALSADEIAALTRFDTTPPSAPPALVAQPSGLTINLSWQAAADPESGVSAYRILRGTVAGNGKTQIAQVPGTALAYSDAAVLANTTYYYQVAAVNGIGLAGPPSNEAAATTSAINQPPAAPANVLATGGNNQVSVDWADNPEADLAGYRVYRGTTPGGPYSLLTSSLLAASSFSDTAVVNGTTYRYVVTAVDQTGLESTPSIEVTATPRVPVTGLQGHWALDEGAGTTTADSSGQGLTGALVGGPAWTAGVIGWALNFDGIDDAVTTTFTRHLPAWTVAAWVRSPAAPAAASASGPVHRQAAFQINWNHPDPAYRGAVAVRVAGAWYPASFGPLSPNTWYHLAGTYDGETLRAYKNGVLVTSNSRPSGPPDIEQAALALGRHAVSASFFSGTVDDVRLYDGALSADEILALSRFDTTPPGAPGALAAAAAGLTVNLSWAAAADAESGIGAYRIYRGAVAGGDKTQIAQVAGAVLAYADSAVAAGTTYYYQVSAVNGVGTVGPLSNEASATTGSVNPPPAAPASLLAVAGNSQVALDWADNTEPDLAGYLVYRGVASGGPYTALTPSAITASAFTDTTALNGTPYFYVVTAVDTTGLESPRSGEASATPRADTGLEGHWALDEGSGTTAADSSGHGLAGTLVGGPGWVAGVSGSALSFDGVDDVVTTTFTRNLPAWTVAVWVRSPAPPGSGAASGPVQRDANYQLNWNHPDARFRGAAGVRVGGTWHAASFGPLAANTWYHLVATYDGETLTAYKNGILVASNATPSGPPDAEAQPLVFGRHARSQTAFFAGTVDDIRIWSRALTASEVAALSSGPY